MSGKEEEGVFDKNAFDPCWKLPCGGNCGDCELREKRTHYYEKMFSEKEKEISNKCHI